MTQGTVHLQCTRARGGGFDEVPGKKSFLALRDDTKTARDLEDIAAKVRLAAYICNNNATGTNRIPVPVTGEPSRHVLRTSEGLV